MDQKALIVLIALASSACSSAASGDTSAATQSPAKAAPVLRTTEAEKLGTLAPNTGIAVGQQAPDEHALDIDGHDVQLSTLYQRGPLLLVFYRGGWCPFCNLEIRAFTEAYPEFKKRGVNIVAVSVDKPDKEASLKAQYDIPFSVLSDSEAKIIHAFHVVRQVSSEEYARLRGNNMDLEEYSGMKHHEIAIPAFFLVDQQGTVRWAHSDPDWKVRPSPEQLLAAIDSTFRALQGRPSLVDTTARLFSRRLACSRFPQRPRAPRKGSGHSFVKPGPARSVTKKVVLSSQTRSNVLIARRSSMAR